MNDEFYMDFALKLAEAAEGQTSPNPTVGSVVVKGGEIVGFGAHLKAGSPHAEINALQMAGSNAAGSTVYVTLEPCSHFGKTPPCVDALIRACVSRVVIASLDPNPLVSGKGIAMLKDAGIQVTTGILKKRADALNEAFFYFIQHELPFVTLKQAITLDGKLAAKPGCGEAITGSEVQIDVHHDREKHDAILVGLGTVLADNPSLTNRFGRTKKQPIRIILDTRLTVPHDKIVVTDTKSPTWIFTGSDVPAEKIASFHQPNIEIIKLSQPKIDITEVLQILGKRKVMSLYVEGGKTVNTRFLKSGYFNQMITYIAPKIVGSSMAVPMYGDLDIKQMVDATELKFKQVSLIGKDLKIVSIPK